MTRTLTPEASIHSAADAPLQRLAHLYHLAICGVCSIADYDARKPLERYGEMLWAVGRYRFADAWNDELRKFDWPKPVSQFEGVEMTVSYKELAA